LRTHGAHTAYLLDPWPVCGYFLELLPFWIRAAIECPRLGTREAGGQEDEGVVVFFVIILSLFFNYFFACLVVSTLIDDRIS
jgi:hypothetical protein